jgi:dTDP-4-amino-4,6-dideoxy-D-glucose transaminase
MNKKHVADLALFGGTPLFDTGRPVGQLMLPDEKEFFRRARSMYTCKRFTNNGPLVRELEKKLARMHQVENGVAFANACLGLVLLMDILADGCNGEVIMPAFTYTGLPHLAQWAGQMPCFCDIEYDTHTLDPAEVEKNINANTTSILAVHQVNSPCRIDELETIASKYNVPLFYDSVHGVHCTYNGQPIGGFGRAEVFSLHATKLLNGFEGGYITTNDDQLADVLRKKRNFGIIGEADIVTIGLNAKLNELHAAAALACLEGQKEIVDRNRRRLSAYRMNFQNIPGVGWIPYKDEKERMNYEFALLTTGPDFPFDRDFIVKLFRAENAMAQPYYSPPLHLSSHCPASIRPPSLPVTEKLAREIIQMPVGELVSLEDIVIMADFFRFIYDQADAIRKRAKGMKTI